MSSTACQRGKGSTTDMLKRLVWCAYMKIFVILSPRLLMVPPVMMRVDGSVLMESACQLDVMVF